MNVFCEIAVRDTANATQCQFTIGGSAAAMCFDIEVLAAEAYLIMIIFITFLIRSRVNVLCKVTVCDTANVKIAHARQ
jgi:hypothetical protein